MKASTEWLGTRASIPNGKRHSRLNFNERAVTKLSRIKSSKCPGSLSASGASILNAGKEMTNSDLGRDVDYDSKWFWPNAAPGRSFLVLRRVGNVVVFVLPEGSCPPPRKTKTGVFG